MCVVCWFFVLVLGCWEIISVVHWVVILGLCSPCEPMRLFVVGAMEVVCGYVWRLFVVVVVMLELLLSVLYPAYPCAWSSWSSRGIRGFVNSVGSATWGR